MKNNEVIAENRFRTVASPGAWPSWIWRSSSMHASSYHYRYGIL